MTPEAAERYRDDRLPFWIISVVLCACGILSIFSLDPFDLLSKLSAKILMFILTLAWASSWIKSTVRKIIQEELKTE